MAKLLTTLKFGEWLPDLPENENPGAPYASNVLWVNGAYQPALGFSPLGVTAPARVQGAASMADADGNVHIYAGTGTQLLEYTGTGLANLSAGGESPYTAADGQYWKFTEFSSPSFGNLVLATDFADAVQSMPVGGAGFAALAGAPPKAACIGTLNQFVMLGATEDGVNGNVPNRVQWCGIGNPTYWGFSTLTDQQNQAGQQFLDAVYGPVTEIANGYEYGLIFQQRGITRATYIGGDAIFDFSTYEKQRGAFFPNAPVQLGNLVYFIAADGFCMTDGFQVQQIGHGKCDTSFLNDVSLAYADRVVGALDPINKLIYWCYCSAGNATGVPDRQIAYNYAENRFAPAAQAVSRVFGSRSFGYTMDTLDAVDTDLDLITPSLDNPYWQGGDLQLQAFDGNNRLGTLTGDPLDPAVIDSTEGAPNPGGLSDRDGARPMLTAGSYVPAPTVQILTRNLENEAYTVSAAAAQNARTGRCDLRATGRYIRARVTIPGGANGGFGVATGVDLYGSEAGQV